MVLPLASLAVICVLAQTSRRKSAKRTRRRTKRLVRIEPARPAQISEPVDASPVPGPRQGDESPLAMAAVVRTATHLWRARRYLASAGDNPDARRSAREMDAALQALADTDLVVEDYDGQLHHEGMALEVLAHQEQAELERDTILSTIRPSVYVGDRCVQPGQVIVGVPTSTQENAHA